MTRAWVVVWIALGVFYLFGLSLPIAALPADTPGIRRFRTPPVGPGIVLSQTFRMTVSDLRAVEFRPVPTGADARGFVEVSLVEVAGGTERRVAAARLDAATLLQSQWHRLSFEPVAESRGRDYRLDIRSAEDRPASGVAVWATRGTRYGGGALLINGTERWADMGFRAVAANPAVWQALAAGSSTRLGIPAGVAIIAMFLLQWVVLGTILRYFLPGVRERAVDQVSVSPAPVPQGHR
jgi:hypothetical protein